MVNQTKTIIDLVLLIALSAGIGLLISIIFNPTVTSIYTNPNIPPPTAEKTVEIPVPQININTNKVDIVDRNDILQKHYGLKQNKDKLNKDYWDFFDEVNKYERQIGPQPSDDDLEELYRLKGRLEELDQIRHNAFSELYDFSKLHNIPL